MNTTKLNKTTKKAEKWINEYKNSFCSSVENFYKRCSYEKIQAENTIKKRIMANNCHNYKVLNGNCHRFTCGFTAQDDKTLFIVTASNIFEIEL